MAAAERARLRGAARRRVRGAGASRRSDDRSDSARAFRLREAGELAYLLGRTEESVPLFVRRSSSGFPLTRPSTRRSCSRR